MATPGEAARASSPTLTDAMSRIAATSALIAALGFALDLTVFRTWTSRFLGGPDNSWSALVVSGTAP